jgi:hypothetical protein
MAELEKGNCEGCGSHFGSMFKKVIESDVGLYSMVLNGYELLEYVKQIDGEELIENAKEVANETIEKGAELLEHAGETGKVLLDQGQVLLG